MTKQFRKKLGFTNKGKMKEFLAGKDLVIPNYTLLDSMNERLIDIFTAVNTLLPVPYTGDIREQVMIDYKTMRQHGIIEKMNNHGRSIESVYYTWRMGSLAELVFANYIADKLNLSQLEKNGGDDLSNPETFKRVGDADLIDVKKNIRIDVQCGTGDGVATIKKHKVEHALKNSGTSYCFLAGLLTGQYAIINLNELKDAHFYENPRWENQLCWDVPEDMFKDYHV